MCSDREETVYQKEEGQKGKDACDRQPDCVDWCF